MLPIHRPGTLAQLRGAHCQVLREGARRSRTVTSEGHRDVCRWPEKGQMLLPVVPKPAQEGWGTIDFPHLELAHRQVATLPTSRSGRS